GYAFAFSPSAYFAVKKFPFPFSLVAHCFLPPAAPKANRVVKNFSLSASPETVSRFVAAVPPSAACNHNSNTPMVPSRSRADSSSDCARPSPATVQKTFPNTAAPPPAASHRNTSPPNAPFRPRLIAPVPCRKHIHHPQSIPAPGFRLQSPATKPALSHFLFVL